MSLLADAESPKVAFENVELKNNENGAVKENSEAVKEKPGDKCKRLCCDNKIVVLLICLIIIGIVVGIVLGFAAVGRSKQKVVSTIPTNFRLPATIIPRHYVLEVQPYLILDHFTFEGKVEIFVKCVQATDVVIMHSKDLNIKEDDVRIRSVNNDFNIKVSKVEYNTTQSFLILRLAESLEDGEEYVVFVSFDAKLQDDGKGFYVSGYEDDKGKPHYVASTQYEAIHAREGFPCFDEPAYKATFQITIMRWKNMSSLSNMPRIKTEQRGKDWVADTFFTSMRMSTYLVAYYVGEYVGKTQNKIRVWAPKNAIDMVDFALDLGNKALPFFEKMLGVAYDAPKMDMIPVTQLVAAAMENWGLIIYADSQLLYNMSQKRVEHRQEIATTVLHEMAHQWFGNLVTPKWWSEIWLSEGMTTYMEYVVSMALFPEWNEIDKTIKHVYQDVFESDCVRGASVSVWKNITAEKIRLPGETFGEMTYRKGAMMGHMMHRILGNDTFWRGISAYLKEFSYQNVEEKDMWRHLTEAQFGNKKIDMAKTMWSWTHQSGSPIITVDRDYGSRTATFHQNSCKPASDESHKEDLWHVPISYTTARSHEFNPGIQTWLKERKMTLMNMPKDDEWILVNGNSVGYYLVNYDKKNWELLAEQLRNNHEVFSTDQRFKILADVNMLYLFEIVGVEPLLDIMSYLGNEKVLSIFSHPNLYFLNEFTELMFYSYYDDEAIDYYISIFGPIQKKLGWNIDPDTEFSLIRLLRGMANRNLCNLDYEPCVEEAIRRFDVWRKEGDNQTEVTFINRDYVLCAAVRSGPSNITEYILRYYKDDDQLNILSCSEDETVIAHIIDFLNQDWTDRHFSLIYHLMGNKEYWENVLLLVDEFFTNSRDIQTIVKWLRAIQQRGLRSQEQRKKFRELVEKHRHQLVGEEILVRGILQVTEWEKIKNEKTKRIGEWLKKNIMKIKKKLL